MRTALVVLVIVLCAVLINAVRNGEMFPIVQTLPGLGGDRPICYTWGGIGMLIVTLWGISRLYGGKGDA